MDIVTFIITIVVVTASGALAPGPLFFVNLAHGTKSGAKGGLAFSIGHTLVEFSLVVLLALGLSTVVNEPTVQSIVGIIGGAFLLVFGLLQIRRFVLPKTEAAARDAGPSRNPVLLGSVFTGLNPYFLIWWLTVGVKLVWDSVNFASWVGVILMYVAHVWMDYVWLTGTAYLAKRGRSLVGSHGYRLAMVAFGAILVGFGVYFLLSSV
jgi:threonine/homoserine/homoserine lactone efflux protein